MLVSVDLSFCLDLSHPDTGEVIELRDYQAAVVDDSSYNRIVWWSRRSGKSLISAIEALNWVLSPGDWPREDFSRVLIFAPTKMHIENVFSKIRGILRNSGLNSVVSSDIKGSPQRITIKYPGGMSCSIVGMVLSSKGLGARGQDGDLVILEEADDISEDALVPARAIWMSRPHVRLLVSGTPSENKKSYMHQVAKNKNFSLHRATILEIPECYAFVEQLKKDMPSQQFETECMVPL